ncbi:hypothetical protein JTE90_007275 [Oedothorax gibbosus]|uniref:Gustatory receptor n=1 Tax=Oedothorax gibbosus TaxID=931172 RepID=A0AAV6VLS1_9ARAC|nr:hypothetical protein JTE90_007275 [Oedothorax gibbosus]
MDVLLYWTSNTQVQDAASRSAMILIGSYSYFVYNTGYPCLVVLSMCLLIQHCVKILWLYEKQLRNLTFCSSCLNTLKDFFSALEIVRLLRNALSLPLLLALVISLLNLFISISTLLIESTDVATILAWEMLVTSLNGSIILLTLTLQAAKIPDSLTKIKETARTLLVKHSKHNFQNGITKETMYLLRRIEESELIQLSACGLIEFKKSFLLSAVGGLSTYGLLVLNFKRTDIKEP